MSIVNTLHHLTPRSLVGHLLLCLAAKRVPFIHGSPATGKSATVAQVARQLNLRMIDHRMSTADSTDLSGLPRNSGDYAEYVPFEEFPIVGQTPGLNAEGKPYDGWLLFLDELNSAPKEVQAACYKLILDRMVGQKHLHEDVYIVAAGNLASDRAIVNQLSTATKSRLIHYVVEVDPKEFYQDVVLGKHFNYRVAGYLAAYPSKTHEFNPESEEASFPAPRTWEFASDLWNAFDANKSDMMPFLDKMDPETWIAPDMAGCLGSSTGEAFVQFCRVYMDLPSLEEITANPNSARLPKNNDASYATVTMLFGNVTEYNLKPLTTYVKRIQGLEFEIIFYRHVLAAHPEWRRKPEVVDMMVRLSELEGN